MRLEPSFNMENRMPSRRIAASVACFACLSAELVYAQAPLETTINFQGYLTDSGAVIRSVELQHDIQTLRWTDSRRIAYAVGGRDGRAADCVRRAELVHG